MKVSHLVSLAVVISPAYAAAIFGCFSSISGSSQGSSDFQSSLHCLEACPNSPYVAVIQKNCFCLSSKPTANSISQSSCSVPCPGFPDETCGGASNVYSVYLNANFNGADAESESPSISSSSSLTSSSLTSSSQTSSSTQSTSSNQSPTEAPATTDGPSSTSEDQDGTSTTHKVITQTSNDGGSLVYVTVTASDNSSPTDSSDSNKKSGLDDLDSSLNKKKSNIGPIVGGAVGGIVGAALLAALAFFLIRRRYSDTEEEDEEEFYDKPSSGLGSRKGTNKGSKRFQSSPLDMPMTNPFDHPNDDLVGAPPSLNTDPRLNPVMMGRRRLSEATIADDTDYSRKILQIANPDA